MMLRRLALPVVVCLAFPFAALAQNSPAQGDADIKVAGIPVRSGTPEEVRAYLQKKLAPKLDAPIVLTDGARTVRRTRGELGVRLDLDRMMAGVRANQKYVPLILTADKAAMKNALERIARGFYQPPISAKPYVYRGGLYIENGTYKRVLDVPTTAERLARKVSGDASTRYFTVSLNKTPAPVNKADLQGITGRLASYATTAANIAPRNHNIHIAVGAINGTVLKPGETFSLNQTVGKRTPERGYQKATVFINAELDEDYGGGVSQVTGTLFNAAALAGLKITQVNPHSRPVAYIPVGRDATVAWGAKDLKFTNNTDAPVYLQYTFAHQRLRATIYGKKIKNQTITLTPRVQRRAPGKIDAQLYRIIKQKGKRVAKSRLFDHQYRWDPNPKPKS